MDSWYRDRCDEMAGRIGGLRACLEMAADYARLGVVPTAGTVEVWRRWIEDGRAKAAPTPGDDLAAARLQADLDAVSRGAVRAGETIAQLRARVAELEAALDADPCDDCDGDCEDCEAAP